MPVPIPECVSEFWSGFCGARGRDESARFYEAFHFDDNEPSFIETTAVDIVAFDAVSAEFAAIEGEGDASLDYWRRVHWDYFGRECARIGHEPCVAMPVVCERFIVVYRGDG
jgi:uncharacterized protein YhfF